MFSCFQWQGERPSGQWNELPGGYVFAWLYESIQARLYIQTKRGVHVDFYCATNVAQNDIDKLLLKPTSQQSLYIIQFFFGYKDQSSCTLHNFFSQMPIRC